MSTAWIAALNVYPVKSCGGIPLARARVAVRGLTLEADASAVSDREWMIVDRNGRFVTQRELPRLALVRVSVDAGALRLSLPGVSACDVSLASPVGPALEVVVWRDTVRAHDAGDTAAAWLTRALDHDVRLVRFDPAQERRCNPEYAGDSGAH